ncbi:MAG: polysaccharide biosynthesis protein [Gemmatimonadales bacterium]
MTYSERRHFRNRYLVAFDILALALVLGFAYAVRFESFRFPGEHLDTFVRFLPVAFLVKIPVFYFAGLYRRLWRHAGIIELERIALATVGTGAAVFVLGVWALPTLGYLHARVPISVAALDAVLTLFVVALPRFTIRLLATRAPRSMDGSERRVIIAGAGAAGELIAKELLRKAELGLMPVAFVDDDSTKHGLELCGLRVVGAPEQLVDFRERFGAEEVVIAMPSSSGAAIRRVMQLAQAAGLLTRTIPGMFEILSGRVSVNSLRPVQIEDLLRRDPIRIDLDRVGELVEGRTVMVSGAGGSIGSEIARQVAALGPGELVLLGHGENSIFNITQELTERFPGVSIIPVVADVRNRMRVDQAFAAHRPAVVLHAAAHKHVPLMEINVSEAITNNLGGSRNMAEAAVEYGVDRFVMISTDKAVRATNVMGATKRAAEQVVQNLASVHGKNFISVRFGNVLGSRGSVVPIFLRQIEAGGPVTVTHPEMRRYFMTIPESVQLVLQAAVLGRGGEVFVLDMGEPVRIVDLARDLIRLSGLEEGKDIEIQFTGVRPGEKLYEELFFGREHAEATDHAKVLRATHAALPTGLNEGVDEILADAIRGRPNQDLLRSLRRLVPDYHPEGSAHNISGLRGRSDAFVGEPSRDADVS